jgi:hypothetical protein
MEVENMHIAIKNLRENRNGANAPYAFRVDRGSVLGNPFKMKNNSRKERNRVCNEYATWLKNNLKTPEIAKKLNEMETVLKEHGKLELWCWCAPKRCHAGEIAKEILRRI